jgi:hypothetical protein
MDAFLIVSAVVCVVAGVWFLVWPQMWVDAIRSSGLYREFWTGPIGMAVNRVLAVIAVIAGTLILLGYVL